MQDVWIPGPSDTSLVIGEAQQDNVRSLVPEEVRNVLGAFVSALRPDDAQSDMVIALSRVPASGQEHEVEPACGPATAFEQHVKRQPSPFPRPTWLGFTAFGLQRSPSGSVEAAGALSARLATQHVAPQHEQFRLQGVGIVVVKPKPLSAAAEALMIRFVDEGGGGDGLRCCLWVCLGMPAGR